MDAIEAILSRRSIRKYTDDPLPDLVVNEILRAAMSAPSAGNEQPWHFVVIRDRSIRASGCRTAPQRLRTCSLQPTPRAWAQYGLASTLAMIA